MALRTHKVTVQQKKDVCMAISARGITILADEPKQNGGSDLGLSPLELLLGSIGSCMAMTLFIYSYMKKIPLDIIDVDIEGDINTEALMDMSSHVRTGFQNIRTHFRVQSHAPEEQVRALIDLAESKCPVGDTVRQGTTVTLNGVTLE